MPVPLIGSKIRELRQGPGPVIMASEVCAPSSGMAGMHVAGVVVDAMPRILGFYKQDRVSGWGFTARDFPFVSSKVSSHSGCVNFRAGKGAQI